MKTGLKFMFSILVFLLGAGCAENPHKAFTGIMKSRVGKNFDYIANRGTLYYPGGGPNAGSKGHIRLSESRNTITYRVNYWRDCYYNAEVNKKTRIIQSVRVTSHTKNCRSLGY